MQQLHADQPVGVVDAQPGGGAATDVAAERGIPVVAEHAGHQLVQVVGDRLAGERPIRQVGEDEAGQRWDDDVEGDAGIRPERGRVRQTLAQREVLGEGARPAVQQQQRDALLGRAGRRDAHEMHAVAVARRRGTGRRNSAAPPARANRSRPTRRRAREEWTESIPPAHGLEPSGGRKRVRESGRADRRARRRAQWMRNGSIVIAATVPFQAGRGPGIAACGPSGPWKNRVHGFIRSPRPAACATSSPPTRRAGSTRSASSARSFSAHGFDEIETPVVEDVARLHSGLGGDNEKLAFSVLQARTRRRRPRRGDRLRRHPEPRRPRAAVRPHGSARPLLRHPPRRAAAGLPRHPDRAGLARRAAAEGPLPPVRAVRHRHHRRGRASWPRSS